MRRWKAFATAALAVVATVGTAQAASARSASEESRFVELINQLRVGKGLPALDIDAGLTATSCGWTDHMVAVDKLSHDPNLVSEVSSAEAGWSKAGENVGVGGDVDRLFQAFVASAPHYRNLVDPAFNAVGVCVTWSADHSRMYTTHRFVANGPAASPAPARAASAPPAPAPSVAPTTEPPTTEPPTTEPPTTEPPTTTTTAAPSISVDALVPVASHALTAGVLVAIAQSTS